MGPCWPGHYFSQFEKRLPQPEIKTSRNPLQSYLVFHSILDLLLKISFWVNVYSSYDIILSYLVKSSIKRNVNRRGEKRAGAGREKSPKITREMNQKHWWAITVIYMYLENGWKRLHIFGNSSLLNREPVVQSLRLRAISHLYWCSNSEVFVDVWLPWKNP